MQLSTQKQVQSWTFDHKLSHKVVYDYKSENYVGVFGNKLRCWSRDTLPIKGSTDRKKYQKIKVSQNYFSLVEIH